MSEIMCECGHGIEEHDDTLGCMPIHEDYCACGRSQCEVERDALRKDIMELQQERYAKEIETRATIDALPRQAGLSGGSDE